MHFLSCKINISLELWFRVMVLVWNGKGSYWAALSNSACHSAESLFSVYEQSMFMNIIAWAWGPQVTKVHVRILLHVHLCTNSNPSGLPQTAAKMRNVIRKLQILKFHSII